MPFPPGTSARDAAFMTAGGVLFWAAHKPFKRGKQLYHLSNFIRIGSATKSFGLGQIGLGAVKYSGAVLGGYILGSALLVGGTAVAERKFGAKEGSTQHAVDFVTGNVDSYLDYVPHVNAYRIVSKYLD